MFNKTVKLSYLYALEDTKVRISVNDDGNILPEILHDWFSRGLKKFEKNSAKYNSMVGKRMKEEKENLVDEGEREFMFGDNVVEIERKKKKTIVRAGSIKKK